MSTLCPETSTSGWVTDSWFDWAMRSGRSLPVAACIELITLSRWQSKVDDSGDCWLWTAAADKHGYGRVSLCGTAWLAHRVAWVGANGRDIQPGMDLNHVCGNPACVRPSHLQEATPRENLLHGNTVPSQRRAREFCPKGHPLTDDNLVRRARGGRECAICKKAYRTERTRLTYLASQITGLSVTEYLRQYGSRITVARRIISTRPMNSESMESVLVGSS